MNTLILAAWIAAIFGTPTGSSDQVGAVSNLDFATIDVPNNPADVNGCGRVGYPYKISRQKVDNRTYAEFLNSVDPDGVNSKALYNPKMMLSPMGGIVFTPGKSEGSRYQTKPGMAESPVAFVGWTDAARFSNWLNNGGRKGSSTEVGIYNLRASKGKMVARNGGGKYCIPNQDELYKAAFFLPTGAGKGKSERLYNSPASESPDPGDIGAISMPVVGSTVFELVDPYDVKDADPQWTAENRGSPTRFQFAGEENPNAEDDDVGFRLLLLMNPQQYVDNEEEEVEEFAGAPSLTNAGFTPSFPAPSSGGQGFGGVFSPVSVSTDLPPSS